MVEGFSSGLGFIVEELRASHSARETFALLCSPFLGVPFLRVSGLGFMVEWFSSGLGFMVEGFRAVYSARNTFALLCSPFFRVQDLGFRV